MTACRSIPALVVCVSCAAHGATTTLPEPARDACDAIARMGESVDGLDVARGDTVVHDYITGTDHPGCQTRMDGSLEVLGRYAAPTDYFRERLMRNGWDEDLRYVADGPTSTAFALRKDTIWCLVAGEWNGKVVIVARCFMP